jgi:hypothetical protein
MSSSSSPPLTQDESKFDKIRLSKASDLSYADFGYFTQEDLNKLKADWDLSGESGGILQGIWMRHPTNPTNKQGNKIIFNQIK